MRRLAAVALSLAAAASLAVAQDAAPPAPAEDPVAALAAEAAAAQGDARAEKHAALGAALEERGRWAEAAEAWRTAHAAKPTAATATGEARALLAFAEGLLRAGEPGSSIRAAFEDARAALQRAVALGAKDVSIRIGLARCLAADGRIDEQIAALEAAAKEFPDDPAPRRALGFALYHARRPADAVAVFRPLWEAAPADANVALTLSDAAQTAGDEELAVAVAERTIAERPDDHRGWERLWRVYSPGRRWSELADRLAALAAKHPGATGARYAGFAAASAQRWDDALARLDDAWRLDPSDAGARLQAAHILLQQKQDRAKATAYAHDVLAAQPGNAKAANLLSFIVQKRSDDGDHEGAAKELEFLAGLHPQDAIVQANLGLELRWSGRYAEAEKAYLRAIGLAPEDARIRNDLALLYLVQGRDEEARAQFAAGHEADPEANDGMENLAWMARRDGRLAEALGWYRKAYAAAVRRGRDVERHRRNMDDARFPPPPLAGGR